MKFEEIELLQSFRTIEKQKKLITNYNMYTYNIEAKELLKEWSIDHFTAPVEWLDQLSAAPVTPGRLYWLKRAVASRAEASAPTSGNRCMKRW